MGGGDCAQNPFYRRVPFMPTPRFFVLDGVFFLRPPELGGWGIAPAPPCTASERSFSKPSTGDLSETIAAVGDCAGGGGGSGSSGAPGPDDAGQLEGNLDR